MLQSIQKLLEKLSATLEAHPTSCGFVAGVVVAFAVLFLIFLVILLLRSRGLRCIEIRSEDGGGMLRLSARAVQDAVRAVAGSFPSFSVRKVELRGSQAELKLVVAMDYLGNDIGGGVSLSSVASDFRSATGQMMTETLGMRKPVRIDLEIVRSLAKYSPAEGSGSKDGSDSGAEPLSGTSGLEPQSGTSGVGPASGTAIPQLPSGTDGAEPKSA